MENPGKHALEWAGYASSLYAVWQHTKAARATNADIRSLQDTVSGILPASTLMFPLKSRSVGGFTFAQKYPYSVTFIATGLAGHPHLGVDYTAATGTPVYAPEDGTVYQQTKGVQGGLTLFFKFDSRDYTMRLMHLSSFAVGGVGQAMHRVSKGELIAYTGNTGLASTGPHLHLDISHGTSVSTGNLDISNFVDPQSWDWGSEPPVSVPVAAEASIHTDVPVSQAFIIRTNDYKVNARDDGYVTSRIFQVIDPNTNVSCKGIVTKGPATVGGFTSNEWYVTSRSGKYISVLTAKRIS